MAKKKLASNKKKVQVEQESWIDLIMRYITGVYLIMVLLGLPLYAPDAYYGIGTHKWKFWIYTSTVYLAVIAVISVIKLAIYLKDRPKSQDKTEAQSGFESIKNWLKKNFSIIDYFFVAYLILCLISSALSPFKTEIWMGAEGWYMGLWSQLCFIFGYFAISRTWKYSNSMIRWAIFVSCVVYFNAILMRFGIDPLGFYTGLTDAQKFEYISTLGQTSWYSSYLAVLLPIAIIAYATAKSIPGKIISAASVILGFMSMVTQDSDSAYMAFAAYMFVLMWIAFNDNDMMLHFWEILIMAFASFKFIGIMQITHPDAATKLSGISTTLSQGNITWLAMGVCVVIYVILMLVFKKTTFKINKIRFIRVLALVIVVVGIAGGISYIVMNTKGMLPDDFSSTNNYLLFDDNWGTYRGFNWKMAIDVFRDEPLAWKLFGCGPDCYGNAVYNIFDEDRINEFFTGYVVLCAHNEWLNMIITCGVIGLISYAGIFFASYIRFIKVATKDNALYGIVMAITAYCAHNIFCYQQVICTSAIIAFIAIAEALIRNGHTENDIVEMNDANEKIGIQNFIKGVLGK